MAHGGMVWINDRDLVDFGVTVGRATGVLGEMSVTPDLVPMAGVAGQSLSSLDLSIKRPLSLRVTVEGTTGTDYQSKVEKLLYFLRNGTLEIRTAHDAAYVLLARFTGTSLPIFPPQWLNTAGEGELTFETIVPYPVERTGLSYAITTAGNAGRIRIPSGSAPTLLHAELMGASGGINNPRLTLYDDLGVKLNEFECTYAGLLNTGVLLIDFFTRRITKSLAGVVTAADDVRRVGDRFFSVRPQQGDWESASWAYLELSAGKAWIRTRRLKFV